MKLLILLLLCSCTSYPKKQYNKLLEVVKEEQVDFSDQSYELAIKNSKPLDSWF